MAALAPLSPAAEPIPVMSPLPVSSVLQSSAELESEIAHLRARVLALQAEVADGQQRGADGIVDLDDERVLQEVGIYNYHHPLENSEAYRERLSDLQDRTKKFVIGDSAILTSDMFTYNNSLAKGRKMTSDLAKLMLRAYNSEADNCVRSLRSGNSVTAIKRLEASVASIAKLGSMMDMRVNPDYQALRVEELELTADYQMMVQHEREEARAERERLREERRADQELAAQRVELDKERSHYANALASLLASGDTESAAELERTIADLDRAIADNDYRAANIRAGYVYVISNPGAFGNNIVKIGLTRRLDPLDRVRELGDASVPFPFDVHALYFSDDAVTLENELHKAFDDLRVNRVNERREFFFATPEQVRFVLAEKVGNLLQFAEHPEAVEYYQSRKYWPSLTTEPGPAR